MMMGCLWTVVHAMMMGLPMDSDPCYDNDDDGDTTVEAMMGMPVGCGPCYDDDGDTCGLWSML